MRGQEACELSVAPRLPVASPPTLLFSLIGAIRVPPSGTMLWDMSYRLSPRPLPPLQAIYLFDPKTLTQ